MTQTADIQKAIEAVFTHSTVTSKRFASLQIGESLRQGDIYLTRVPLDHPRGKPWGSRQVAVGNTVGSRHVATGNVDVFAGNPEALAKYRPGFNSDQLRACTGPVVVAKDGDWDLEHPEHPHHGLMASEPICIQVSYQWNSQTMQAVQD